MSFCRIRKVRQKSEMRRFYAIFFSGVAETLVLSGESFPQPTFMFYRLIMAFLYKILCTFVFFSFYHIWHVLAILQIKQNLLGA